MSLQYILESNLLHSRLLTQFHYCQDYNFLIRGMLYISHSVYPDNIWETSESGLMKNANVNLTCTVETPTSSILKVSTETPSSIPIRRGWAVRRWGWVVISEDGLVRTRRRVPRTFCRAVLRRLHRSPVMKSRLLKSILNHVHNIILISKN